MNTSIALNNLNDCINIIIQNSNDYILEYNKPIFYDDLRESLRFLLNHTNILLCVESIKSHIYKCFFIIFRLIDHPDISIESYMSIYPSDTGSYDFVLTNIAFRCEKIYTISSDVAIHNNSACFNNILKYVLKKPELINSICNDCKHYVRK